MKKTGALLNAKRESSNLSLSEVALATKINPKILAAIESGEESGMPAKTILKGFVKSYALFLKMDVEEVLRSFQEETSPSVAVAEPTSQAGEVSSRKDVRKEVPRHETSTSVGPSARRRVDEESSSGMRTAAVVVIVLLIGLIIGVRELIEKYQAEKVVEQPVELKAKPLENVAQPVDTAEPEKLAEVEPTKPTESEKVAEPAESAKAAEPAKPSAAPNMVELRGVKIDDKPVEVQSSAEEKPAETVATKPGPTPIAATIKAAKNEIILEALDNVELKFKLKGESKKVSLGPTQVHTIRSDEPTTIDVSDGGAVNVILNGRDRGPAGDLGKPKTITIP